MHRRSLLTLVALLMLAAAVSAGCAKKPADTGVTPGTAEGQAQPMSEAEIAARNLAETKRVIMTQPIYFEFDSFELQPSARATLKDKADVLRQKPGLHVLIEGHCDERGTEEYNLALGERRARAAYNYLVLLGVNAGQLEMVSYGEERPAVQGSGEEVWAKNRRDEFKLVW